MTNVLKHASAEHVSIRFQVIENASILALELVDDGYGFDHQHLFSGSILSGTRKGIQNMRFRTNKLNGTLNFNSSPKNGTKVYLSIPINPPQYKVYPAENPTLYHDTQVL
jgi:signal transduction histidine kinase